MFHFITGIQLNYCTFVTNDIYPIDILIMLIYLYCNKNIIVKEKLKFLNCELLKDREYTRLK